MYVWLFTRKIGRAAFRSFDFHFFARLDLDQRLGRHSILLVGFQPDRPAEHIRVVIDGDLGTGPAALHLALADFVRTIQIVVARPNGNFQPAVAAFITVQESSVGPGNIHARGVRHRVTDVVRGRFQRAKRL